MKSFIGNFILIITIIIVNFAEPGAAEASAIDYDNLVYDDKAQSTFIATIKKIHEMDWGSGKGKTTGYI